MTERRIAVAYSGGRDSTALLHATLQQAARDGVHVVALHIHHGLSPHADAWLDHAAAQCQRWARRGLPVSFLAKRIEDRPERGDSVEAWARQARYRALRELALTARATVVLLAHHRRDQAETFLLQALRGAGPAGLSGMPMQVVREGITWHRPWLDRPRAEIEAYVKRHRLKFVDDDSNADPRFARNRLRLAVWPALVESFEQAEASLADAATWAQQACAVLDEVAALDLAVAVESGALVPSRWRALSAARRGLALREWLRQQLGAPPPASLAERLGAELDTAKPARWPVSGGTLRLYRDRLRFQPVVVDPASVEAGSVPPESTLSVRRAGMYALPGWQGALRVTPVAQGGVPMAWLARLELRARAGGEQFQAGVGRPPRSLKKQYQAAGVPEDQRRGPLVYSGSQLVFVPGLGIDARVIGLPTQETVALDWVVGRDAPAAP